MKRFEYKLVKVGVFNRGPDDPVSKGDYAERTAAFFNKHGDEGWELVMYGTEHLVFKREKEPQKNQGNRGIFGYRS